MSTRFKFVRTKKGLVTLISVVVLLLFLVRPEVNRLRAGIVDSISLALGRPVEVSSVSLRLLPQPGFDLENFVVHDDPSISAEPVLRAAQVAANIRLGSLMRGRLEIARLNLTEPSLNLVRSSQGHWNVEQLVERASKTPVAPTGKANGEVRPGFPYIEASGGRINLKLGQEKKPYVLTDADFTLWQESEDTWGMRLKAQPTRTDFNLSDTGIVRVEGAWRRAQVLRETPLRFKLQWEQAQLGQFTKFLSGGDKGWRGRVLLYAEMNGSPADLKVAANGSLQDFRRYDIMGGGPLNLSTQCTARYSSITTSISDLSCQSPVGDGSFTIAGNINGLHRQSSYDLTASASDIPVQALVALLRCSKKDIPNDVLAAGKMSVSATLHRDELHPSANWQGKGEVTGLRLLSPSTNADLVLDRVPLMVRASNKPGSQNISSFRLDLGPVSADVGTRSLLKVGGWVSREGYALQARGEAHVRRLMQVARMLGLPSVQTAAQGTANVDLHLDGVWEGFPPPSVSGTAHLTAIKTSVNGLSTPLEIASATAVLLQDEVKVQNLTVSLAGSTWRGSLTLPRGCVAGDSCPVRFDLRTRELSVEKVSAAFAGDQHTKAWYRFLTSAQPGASYISTLNAQGRLTVGKLTFRNLSADQISANVDLKNSRLRLRNLEADVLGGQHSGEWILDFSGKLPQYSGQGKFQSVALDDVAEAMQDPWVTGTASASYEMNVTGRRAEELAASLSAAADVDVYGATMPRVILSPNHGPIRAQRFSAHLVLRNGRLEVQEGKLETAGGIYQVSGTASRGTNLNIRLVRDGSHSFDLTGTLVSPKVTQVDAPDTRAALKPQ